MPRHQVKSQWYYIFWGLMAVAVTAGQLYVGTGYRIMSRELRSFSQAVYDSQTSSESSQQPKKRNLTYEFE